MNSDERWDWADLLRVLAIFAVVLLHSAAPLLLHYRDGATGWWIGNAYDSAVRWSVPLFVMLSGALLLARDEPLPRFLGRRLRKVVVPLVAWSVIYFLWTTLVKGKPLAASELFESALAQPVYYHLWFFYMLIGLYLLAPVLRPYLLAVGQRGAWYLLAIWFLWASVLPLFEQLTGLELYYSPGVESSPVKFVGYFVMGWMFKDLVLDRRQVLGCALLFLVGYAVTLLGTYYLTVVRNAGKFDPLLYEYFSVNVLVMAVAIFLIGKSLPLPSWLAHGRALRSASLAVLGIYVVHALLIELLKGAFEERSLAPALGVPLFAAVTFALSLGVVLLLKKVPVLKELVP